MIKIIRIGKHEGMNVYCKIEIKEKDGKKVLSISGVEGPKSNGDCKGSCGQIVMGMESSYAVDFAEGWDQKMFDEFVTVWNRWHLNDMKSACEHQRELNITYNEDPKNVCVTCGYKIGSAWLHEDLPESVITFLNSLPETDQRPAWV